MSKFGELIDSELPILLDFYTDWNESSTSMHPVLKDVAAAIGDKGKLIKINVDKNQAVANKFNDRGIPTFILFQSNEIKWRKSGLIDKNILLEERESSFING